MTRARLMTGVLLIFLATSVLAQPVPPPACGPLPSLGQTQLRTLAERFPGEIRSASDDGRRVWALKAAEQLAFALDPAFGSKRSANGHPQTRDGIARFAGGRLCVWDVVNGATRELHFGDGEDITGQVFIPVTPRNWIGAPPVPPPPPTELLERVAGIERELAAAKAELAALAARREWSEAQIAEEVRRWFDVQTFAIVGSTGRTFGHTHGVQLPVRRQ